MKLKYNIRSTSNLLGLAITTALALSACGGGGGGSVRPDPPPPPPPGGGNPPPPPPQVCNDPNATNNGGSLPCTYRYNGQADNLLVGNNADLAHAEGFTGAGVKIGFLDTWRPVTGTAENAADEIKKYAPISGRFQRFYDTNEYDEAVESDGSHGKLVSLMALGSPHGAFKGGVAPNALLYALHGYTPDAMLKDGVRLINSSASFAPTELAGRSDALFVVSAGNHGADEPGPGTTGNVPNPFPEFRDHYITAIALHASLNGERNNWENDPWEASGEGPSHPNASNHPRYEIYRANYSSACGNTAKWCVGAIVNTKVPSVHNQDEFEWFGGTSGAAPTVTGVAALVWEAYPWMSANNVQQTVLTTATDIGEPGVDPVYGWGLVNARKAIDGPAQFISDDFMRIHGFTANFEGESRPFYNDISGEGWLRKLGTGTLTLTGNNTYTGGTVVEGGTLRSTGSFGSDVEVAPGATFMTGGTGVTINGHYDAYDAGEWNRRLPPSEWKTGIATTAIQIGAPLTVTGEVDIGDNDTRLLLLPEAENYTVQATETLITAGEGLFGRFGQVDYGNGFFWTASLNYGPNALTANMTRAQAQAKAMSIGAPQQVVDGARVADTLIGHLDRLVESGQAGGNSELLSATARLMATPSDEHAALSLSSLTGDIHGAARALGVQRSLGEGERLADRLRSLNEPGMWVNSGNGNGTLSRVGYGDTEVHHSAFGFGTETRVSDAWTVGLAASQTRSNAHLDTLGGRLTGQGQQMAVYGRRDIGTKGYLTGLVSHDRHTVDTHRRVLTGTTLNSVVGQHEDTALLARLETGIRLKGGLTPYLAAGSLSLRQGGFTESGTLGLSAGADTFSSRFVDVGSRFDWQSGNWMFGSTLSARKLFGGNSSFNAAFTGAEVASFTVNGQPLARTSIRFGSDLAYQTRNGWNLSLGLGAENGTGQRANAWGEATVRLGF